MPSLKNRNCYILQLIDGTIVGNGFTNLTSLYNHFEETHGGIKYRFYKNELVKNLEYQMLCKKLKKFNNSLVVSYFHMKDTTNLKDIRIVKIRLIG